MISILAAGNWSPHQLVVTTQPDSRTRNDEVDRLIEREWAQAIARPGVKLFDGQMCRFESCQVDGEYLKLGLSTTSYKIFVGTNQTNPQLADRFGRNVLANPIGVSSTVLTSDGFLMLGRRNGSVAYYPNRVHPFAGSLEPGENVFAAARRELHEEIGFNSDDISQIYCSGIVEDLLLRHPELLFCVTTQRSRDQVMETLDRTEHSEAWSIPGTADAIEKAAQNPELTPVAGGSLLLWGRLKFGTTNDPFPTESRNRKR